MSESTFTCSICKEETIGFGNNPWPVTEGEDDSCCDSCNETVVIPARFAQMRSNLPALPREHAGPIHHPRNRLLAP